MLWSRQRYRELLAISGGKERIRDFMAEDDPAQTNREGLDDWIAGLRRVIVLCEIA